MGFFDFSKRMRRTLAEFQNTVAHRLTQMEQSIACLREAVGRVEARQLSAADPGGLAANEFKVWSQWGEDGILQHLIRHVEITNRVFVEFGVENYTEANTRFLLTQNSWSGLVLDGGVENIEYIRRDPVYWRHNLKAVCAFITRENINGLLAENGLAGEIGLLSVDIDGNDYWVWEAITAVLPALVVVEYNSRFGSRKSVTIPYDPSFQRVKAHHSTAYYGASLAALVSLGKRKGYAFVGSNSAGNNAFFVRRGLMAPPLREVSVEEGYVERGFRETRDKNGHLVFPSPEEESALVNSLPLVEV